nr:NADH dehydrogenase subunit 3 [Trichophilopterus babakotophilus]
MLKDFFSNIFLIWLFIIFFMSMILWMFSAFFSYEEENFKSNEIFECGMDLLAMNYIPMSIHFYMVSMLFLIFDIEFIISIPLVFMMIFSKFSWTVFWFVYMSMLMVGLYMELWLGSIDWKSNF